MFSVFFEFFDKGIFTDVKLYGGHGKKFIRCHAIILVSAIPGMKEVLGQVSDHEEEGITILLPEDSFESIKSTISDIYLAAKKEVAISDLRAARWSRLFGLEFHISKSDLVGNDTRPKRKRRQAPPQYEDFETFSDDPDSSTDQRKTRRKMAKLKNNSKSTHNKDCINEEYLRRVNKKVNDGLVKHKHEILEVIEKDLQETSWKLAEPEDLQINTSPIKVQKNTSVLKTTKVSTSDCRFNDLEELTDSLLGLTSPSNKVLVVKTGGIYLREGSQPVFPWEKPLSTCDMDILLIPNTFFVALFAAGVSNGENIYHPIALMHKDFNQKKMLSNFFLMIRRLTGISKTTNVHLIPKDASEYLINNESHFNELKSRLTDYLMSMESDHDSIQDEDFDERKLEIVSLPPMEYQMKFKIVQDISPEDVVDFHIVYGNSLDGLIAQSYMKQSQSDILSLKKAKILLNSMSAFCGLSNTDQLLHLKPIKEMVNSVFLKAAAQVLVTKLSLPSALALKRNGDSDVCNQVFKIKSKETPVECKCPATFESESEFRDHLKNVHIKNRKYKCAFGHCNQFFKNEQSLQKHYQSIHEKSLEDGVGVVCDSCGQTFVNQYYLKAHFLCYHKEFSCSDCGEIIYGKNAREKHHRDVHATFDDHLCQHCGKGFKMKKYLQIHIINSHTAKQDKPFPCHLCEKGFNNHMKLTQHLDGVHYKRKPHKCRAPNNVCTMAFSAQSTRKRHEKVAHQLDIRMPQGRKSTSKVDTDVKVFRLEDLNCAKE